MEIFAGQINLQDDYEVKIFEHLRAVSSFSSSGFSLEWFFLYSNSTSIPAIKHWVVTEIAYPRFHPFINNFRDGSTPIFQTISPFIRRATTRWWWRPPRQVNSWHQRHAELIQEQRDSAQGGGGNRGNHKKRNEWPEGFCFAEWNRITKVTWNDTFSEAHLWEMVYKVAFSRMKHHQFVDLTWDAWHRYMMFGESHLSCSVEVWRSNEIFNDVAAKIQMVEDWKVKSCCIFKRWLSSTIHEPFFSRDIKLHCQNTPATKVRFDDIKSHTNPMFFKRFRCCWSLADKSLSCFFPRIVTGI